MIKLKNNDIILFQGDSITDGNRGRNEDLNHIHGHGYQYILTAELSADNIEKNAEFINRGISGNRIADLYGRWQEDCLSLKPTILSILIGINDFWAAVYGNTPFDPENFESTYRSLLDKVLEQNPDTLIILMEPFFGTSEEKDFDKFCKEHIGILSEKTRKIAEEYNAAFVPLQDMFTEYSKKTDIKKLLWDGVHPTTLAHELIARRWKEVAEGYINDR